ncbi:MAG: hypothetical protein CVU44_17045 [Chloroflexi bacterium HGW-Chloroflexi-6]|nr:MAG: hypothetical protein CVU44_17045 [Chloroflexi bacterium HGW-Chloroflexi-6]
MATDSLQNAQKRAMQYWYVDGTFEFSFGGICLILAAYFYANYLLAGSWLANLLTALFVLIIIGGSFLVNRLVMTMKERITFPRTGYIAFQRKSGASRLGRLLLIGVVAATISALMTLFLLQPAAGFDRVVAVSGILFGAVLVYLGFRTGMARFFINAAIGVLAGLALGFANLPENLGLTSFYGVLGLALLTIGGISLWQYLRQNPNVQPDGGDDEK